MSLPPVPRRRRQHGDGLEDWQPAKRDNSASAPRRSLGLATIVPRDAGQQTGETVTRGHTTLESPVAWQLTKDPIYEQMPWPLAARISWQT